MTTHKKTTEARRQKKLNKLEEQRAQKHIEGQPMSSNIATTENALVQYHAIADKCHATRNRVQAYVELYPGTTLAQAYELEKLYCEWLRKVAIAKKKYDDDNMLEMLAATCDRASKAEEAYREVTGKSSAKLLELYIKATANLALYQSKSRVDDQPPINWLEHELPPILLSSDAKHIDHDQAQHLEVEVSNPV